MKHGVSSHHRNSKKTNATITCVCENGQIAKMQVDFNSGSAVRNILVTLGYCSRQQAQHQHQIGFLKTQSPGEHVHSKHIEHK